MADGPEAIRATVRKLRKYGAEVIKFCGTGGVLSKTDTAGGQQYSLEEMKALVDEAHMLGLRVAVHAHGAAGIKDAIRAGADTIEHCSLAVACLCCASRWTVRVGQAEPYHAQKLRTLGRRSGRYASSRRSLSACADAIGRKLRSWLRRRVRA